MQTVNRICARTVIRPLLVLGALVLLLTLTEPGALAASPAIASKSGATPIAICEVDTFTAVANGFTVPTDGGCGLVAFVVQSDGRFTANLTSISRPIAKIDWQITSFSGSTQ